MRKGKSMAVIAQNAVKSSGILSDGFSASTSKARQATRTSKRLDVCRTSCRNSPCERSEVGELPAEVRRIDVSARRSRAN